MKLTRESQRHVWMWLPALVAAILFLWFYRGDLTGQPEFVPPHFERGTLVIVRASEGEITFDAEIARTRVQQSYGLMFRESLPHNAAMIFPEETDRVVNFWMHNTLIPLDMLFVKRNGAIAKIAANAQPMNRALISSDEPVAAVVEINGGDAARLSIKTGDIVKFPGLGDMPNK